MSRQKNSKYQHIVDHLRTNTQVEFPTLHWFEVNSLWGLHGTFPVRLNGLEIDHYLLEITLPLQYPDLAPLVKEIGNRIPRTPDWHVNPDASLCLWMIGERWRYWSKPVFLDFLRGPVNDFLLGATYRFHTGKYPFGERAHGQAGIIDYLKAELDSDELGTIIKCLNYVARGNAKGHWPCYCGSGLPMRKCHFAKYLDIQGKVSSDEASRILFYLKQQ